MLGEVAEAFSEHPSFEEEEFGDFFLCLEGENAFVSSVCTVSLDIVENFIVFDNILCALRTLCFRFLPDTQEYGRCWPWQLKHDKRSSTFITFFHPLQKQEIALALPQVQEERSRIFQPTMRAS